jgi:hypothetical protein
LNPADYPDILPRRKPLKRLVNRVVLFALGRGLQSLSKHDPLIQQEVSKWPDPFTLMLVVRPDCGSMAVSRAPGGRLIYRGSDYPEEKADVVITIKNIETAFAMLIGKIGIDVGYARHSICARGDISNSVSVVRVLNIAEAYLFPSMIAKNLMKRLPPIPPARKYLLRLKAYGLGIPFGL